MSVTKAERIFYVINYVFLTMMALSCLFPIIHVFALSLSGQQAIQSGKVALVPVEWTKDSYFALIKGTNIVQSFTNSVEITVVGVSLSMVMTILAAYPLSRSYFYGKRMYMVAIIFTLMFGGGIIPNYLLVKSLGLLNTFGALWFPGLIVTFNMLILCTFFQQLPEELMDAAQIDGAGEWRTLVRIVLPLSLPSLATVTLFYGVGYWNSFFNVLMYMTDSSKLNMTVLVQRMIQSEQLMQDMNTQVLSGRIQLTPEGIKAAGIFVLILPMMLVYPFVQKYFVKGVMLGSVKG